MADEKNDLPGIQKEIDDLDKRAKRPLSNSPEDRKERDDILSKTLSLSARIQSQMSPAEYGTMQGTPQGAAVIAAVKKLGDITPGMPNAGTTGSPVGQMLSGYPRRQGGVGGIDEGSGGGVGRYSGGRGEGVSSDEGGETKGPSGGQYSGGKASVVQAVVDEWKKAGMSDAGIAGVLANIQHESNFKPGILEQHPTGSAKRQGGGHGLYQFTGEEWTRYQGWLKKNHPNANWTDPRLQSRFVAKNVKSGNNVKRGTWERMNSGSKEEAAGAFIDGYERPRADLKRQRIAQYNRGVPDIGHYIKADQRPSGSSGSGKWGGVGEAQTDAARVATGTGVIGGERKFSAEQLKSRPMQQQAGMHFEGFKGIDPKEVTRMGSGTAGRLWSAPYGTYSLTPQSLSSATTISRYYGAHGIPKTGPYSTVWNVGTPGSPTSTGFDPAAGRTRGGIQIHAHPDDVARLHSAGCIVMQAKDIPAFQEKMRKAQAQGGAVIEVTPQGYRIIPAHQSKNAITADQAIENKKTTGTLSGQGTPEAKRTEWPGEKEYKGPQKGLDAERVSTETAFGTARSSSIKTELPGGRGGGTAFSIGDGHFITASHYLGDNKSLNLGRGDTLLHADILHRNPEMDYALLKASPEDTKRLQEAGLTTSQLAKEPSKIGDTLTMQGFSGKEGPYTTASGKIIKREDVPIQYPVGSGKVTATAKDAYLMEPGAGERGIEQRMPGTSGGPVTDEKGHIQGLVSGGGQGPEGMRMFSAPMHRIIEDIPENLRQNIPQLRERLEEEKKKQQWPGEKEYKGPQKGLAPVIEGADGKPARGQPSPKAADGTKAPQAAKAAEQARGGRIHIPGKSLAGVDPELKGRLEAMYKAAPASAKAGFYTTSGRRDIKLQAQLYKRYQSDLAHHIKHPRIAARPGFSQHEKGLAIDVHDPHGWFHQHAKEYGLGFPVKGDYPHMQKDPSYKGPSHAQATTGYGDTRPHEIKKGALREKTEQKSHPDTKPQKPPQQRTSAQQEPAHRYRPPIKHSDHFAATDHAKSSGSTNSRVQHSYRTRHALDENFHNSSNPNSETA